MTKISPQQLLILGVMPPYGPPQDPKSIAQAVGCSNDTCKVQLNRLKSYGFVDQWEGRWGITPEGRLALAEPGRATEERVRLCQENISRLEIEVTKELMERIEKAAKENLVTPEHMVCCTLSSHFADRKKKSWLSPKILEALRDGIASALAAINREDRQGEK